MVADAKLSVKSASTDYLKVQLSKGCMVVCDRFADCPFLNNFHKAADTIRASGDTGRPDYGLFIVNAPAIQENIMNYLCNEHPEECAFYGQKHAEVFRVSGGPTRELAKEIRRLKYGCFADLLGDMGDDAMSRSEVEVKCGRPQISKDLEKVAEHLYEAEEAARNASKTSRPHVQEK